MKGNASLTLAGILLASCLLCFPAVRADDDLSLYEQALFFQTYETESTPQRLSRLEDSLYGGVQNGTEAQRKAHLLDTLKEIPRNWKTTTSEAEQPEASNPTGAAPAETYETANSDATDYPTVTALEMQIFGRDFIREDINNRLNRLEKKVFGQPSPQKALIDRVDQLLAKYPNVVAQTAHTPAPSNSVLQQLPSDSSQFVASSRDAYVKIAALERNILGQESPSGLLLTERLDRLEAKSYGRSFTGESIDTRLARLMKGYQTSRIASSQRQVYTTPQTTYSKQNIQIGAGFSQNSQHQFSQDLLNMLPNDVRAQLTQPNNNTGTIISAPSTVVIEQTQTQNSGFQTFGGAPIQHYNYYRPPNIQSKTTTTVIQPDGSSIVYGYEQNGIANPAYVGDPAFLQELGSIEANVFGRVDTMAPVQTRLQNLEMAILHKSQPQYPEAQRLQMVFRAWKIQQISRVLSGGSVGSASRLGVPLTGH